MYQRRLVNLYVFIALLISDFSHASQSKYLVTDTININNLNGCTVSQSIHGISSQYDIVKFPYRRNLLIDFRRHVNRLKNYIDPNRQHKTVVKFIDDKNSPNAIAFNRGLDSSSDYTILFGVEMYINSLKKEVTDRTNTHYTLEVNDVFISSVIAHEFAHITQYINNVNAPTRNTELMADIISGWYVAMNILDEGRNKYLTEKENKLLQYTTNKTYSLGDYGYNHPDHHGTPDERLSAFNLGFNLVSEAKIYDFWKAYKSAKNIMIGHNRYFSQYKKTNKSIKVQRSDVDTSMDSWGAVSIYWKLVNGRHEYAYGIAEGYSNKNRAITAAKEECKLSSNGKYCNINDVINGSECSAYYIKDNKLTTFYDEKQKLADRLNHSCGGNCTRVLTACAR